MARNKPDLKIRLDFSSGKCYKIDLFLIAGGLVGRYFKIRFTDCEGVVSENQRGGTISRLVDRLRRLIVKELPVSY